LVFLVEIRKERHVGFLEIGGFFSRNSNYSIVATDERDAMPLRTNVRGEDAYLLRHAPLDDTAGAPAVSGVWVR